MDGRCQSGVLGAFVADAAALGYHWVYDVARLQEMASSVPAFQQPDAKNYQEGTDYFAHASRCAGDLSEYGESALLFFQAQFQSDGGLDLTLYQSYFWDCFGYGGSYHGYIDGATKVALDNINQGNSLLSGGDSVDSPAMASFPFLASSSLSLSQQLELANQTVRITNNADQAVAYVQSMLVLFEHFKVHDDKLAAIAAAAEQFPELTVYRRLLEQPLASIQEAGAHFGIACGLASGVPLALSIWLQVDSYQQAIDENILAGGDSCGRAMLLGYLSGFTFGEIPEAYLNQFNKRLELELMITSRYEYRDEKR